MVRAALARQAPGTGPRRSTSCKLFGHGGKLRARVRQLHNLWLERSEVSMRLDKHSAGCACLAPRGIRKGGTSRTQQGPEGIENPRLSAPPVRQTPVVLPVASSG